MESARPANHGFKIKYLDFSEVGDSKVTWELNRHQHLVTLAKAFRLNGDPKFASEFSRSGITGIPKTPIRLASIGPVVSKWPSAASRGSGRIS